VCTGVTTELNATMKHSKLRLFPGELAQIMQDMATMDHPETLRQTVRRMLSEPSPMFFVSAKPNDSSRSNSIDEETTLVMDSPREIIRTHATRSPIKRTLEDPDEGAPSKRLAHAGSMKRASSSPALMLANM